MSITPTLHRTFHHQLLCLFSSCSALPAHAAVLFSTRTGRQPGHLRKNSNKKRQISVRENWRAKDSHYYAELYGTIMPMQCYTCPEEEQCFF